MVRRRVQYDGPGQRAAPRRRQSARYARSCQSTAAAARARGAPRLCEERPTAFSCGARQGVSEGRQHGQRHSVAFVRRRNARDAQHRVPAQENSTWPSAPKGAWRPSGKPDRSSLAPFSSDCGSGGLTSSRAQWSGPRGESPCSASSAGNSEQDDGVRPQHDLRRCALSPDATCAADPVPAICTVLMMCCCSTAASGDGRNARRAGRAEGVVTLPRRLSLAHARRACSALGAALRPGEERPLLRMWSARAQARTSLPQADRGRIVVPWRRHCSAARLLRARSRIEHV